MEKFIWSSGEFRSVCEFRVENINGMSFLFVRESKFNKGPLISGDHRKLRDTLKMHLHLNEGEFTFIEEWISADEKIYFEVIIDENDIVRWVETDAFDYEL